MWWVNKFGNVTGPYSDEQIRKGIRSNQFTKLNKISEDQQTWMRIDQSVFWNPSKAAPEELSLPGDVKRRKIGGINRRAVKSEVACEAVADAHLVSEASQSTCEHWPIVFSRHSLVVLAAIFGALLVAVSVVLTVIIISPSGLWNADSGRSGEFQAVYAKKKSAIGCVVMVLTDKQGNDTPVPLGTAFAVGRDRFVTNAHVAYGLKNYMDQCVNAILVGKWNEEARNRNLTLDQFVEQLGERGVQRDVALVKENLKDAKFRVKNAEIRLSNSDRRLKVDAVCVHRDYHPNTCNASEEELNQECDIAILTVAEKVDCWFDILPDDKVCGLQAGMLVASAGFPIEGVHNGGMDVNAPVATFASGEVKKMTDGRKRDAGKDRNYLITHTIPAAGGASGSPIFTPKGKVVGVLWGGEIAITATGERTPSALMQNYGVRIDQLRNVGQAERWTDWVNQLQ